MVKEKWKVTFIIFRKKGDENPHYESQELEVDPDEYILDGIERIWAFHDHSLTFRHACHHSTCGACGMRVNGVEKLTCITPIRSMTNNGGILRIEPLRNFSVISDLVVNMDQFYLRLDQTKFSQVTKLKNACLPFERKNQTRPDGDFERLVDCIECGLCISACPAAMTSTSYLGPATFAAVHQSCMEGQDESILDMVDTHDGIWRCHSAFECSAVCPSNVDPAWRIMDLRRKVVGHRIRRLFIKKEPK